MVNAQTTFVHHLFEVAVRKLIATVPSNTEQDEFRFKVPPLKRVRVVLHTDISD
jgi:hypothetical protein